MYGYIYLTENLVNGMCYIGRHKPHYKGKVDTWYKGSGKIIKQECEKYGKENFIVTLIEWCSNEEELNEKEKYWIVKCNAIESPLFYNIKEGSGGGSHGGSQKGRKLSEKRKQNMSKGQMGHYVSPETKQKMSNAQKGRHWKIINGLRVYTR